MKIMFTTRKMVAAVFLIAFFIFCVKFFFTVTLEGNFDQDYYLPIKVINSNDNLPIEACEITVIPYILDNMKNVTYRFYTDSSGSTIALLHYSLGSYYRLWNKSRFVFFKDWKITIKKSGFDAQTLNIDLSKSELDYSLETPPLILRSIVIKLAPVKPGPGRPGA